MPFGLILACAAMLVVGGFAKLPYGYYTILRFVACGTFAFAAYVAADRKRRALPWAYGVVAIVFNPFVKVHLPKEMWTLVDVGAAIFLVLTARVITEQSAGKS